MGSNRTPPNAASAYDPANVNITGGAMAGVVADGTVKRTVETGVTARAGGGKGSATALSATSTSHYIGTCATAGDSVLVPAVAAGQWRYIYNGGAAACQLFGAGTDTINGVATGTGVTLPAGQGVLLVAHAAGTWTTSPGVGSFAATTLTVTNPAGVASAFQVGTGSGALAGIIVGYAGSTAYGGIWSTGLTPSLTNAALLVHPTVTALNAVSSVYIQCNGGNKVQQNVTAGEGPIITAGTATTAVNALSASQTWNNAAVKFTAQQLTPTLTAYAAGSAALKIGSGNAGTEQGYYTLATNAPASTVNYWAMAAGAGGANLLEFVVNGVRTGAIYAQSGGTIELNFGTLPYLLLTSATRIQFGGSTASFPAFKRNSTTVAVRLADDSADAPLTASNLIASGYLKGGTYTVAGLPSASASGANSRSYVTDANTTHAAGIGTTVSGGGSNKCPVVSDGANWIIG